MHRKLDQVQTREAATLVSHLVSLSGFNTISAAVHSAWINDLETQFTVSQTRRQCCVGEIQDVVSLDRQLGGDPVSVVYKILRIQILDVNDNSPYFINAPYTVRVNELTPVGVTVFRGILADDLDEGPNKQITYSLTLGYSQDNAVPASTQRSSLTTLRVIITDGDDQGPEFVYPSCVQSSQPNSRSCVRPKYLTSVYSENSSEISLDLKPVPPNPSDPSSPVFMLMQDRDTLNSNITCGVRKTEPAGYESYFFTRSSLYSGKQYRCELIKKSDFPPNNINIASLEIIIEAVEQTVNLRTEYATVVITLDLVDLSTNPPDDVNVAAAVLGSIAGVLFILLIVASVIIAIKYGICVKCKKTDQEKHDINLSDVAGM
ncbi:hypothetical protein Btru_060236 [Bulinus truncatus]|nr:hypothetical protein Btru_060236 [Bulinus truncatus]